MPGEMHSAIGFPDLRLGLALWLGLGFAVKVRVKVKFMVRLAVSDSLHGQSECRREYLN